MKNPTRSLAMLGLVLALAACGGSSGNGADTATSDSFRVDDPVASATDAGDGTPATLRVEEVQAARLTDSK